MLLSWSYLPLARAETVLLFEAPALRPGLCAALRVQLTELAEVSCRGDVVGASLSMRIEAAARAVASERARMGILLERDPDPGVVRMVLVGAPTDQAVIALERIEDRPSPDVDRSLALKVRDALEVMSTTAVALAKAAEQPVAEEPVAEAAPAAASPLSSVLVARPSPPADGWRLSALVEAGAALSFAPQRRGSGGFALGARGQHRGWLLELALGGHIATESEVSPPQGGSVKEDEWGLALTLRGLRRVGWAALGLVGELGVVRVRALGVARDGTQGDEEALALPRLGLGLDLRAQLARGLALRLAPTLELYPIAQYFELEEEPAMKLGRVRLLVPIAFVFDLALGVRRGAAH